MSKSLIGKRSIIYTLSKIISAILSLLSISLFTRIFDADAYGQYLLFVSYVTLICSLFFWWHRLSVYRYYHKYKDQYGSFLKTSYIYFFFIIYYFYLDSCKGICSQLGFYNIPIYVYPSTWNI